MELMYFRAPWYGELLACRQCPVRAEARQVVPGVGPMAADFLFLGQNPGEDEDEAGLPFIGRGGAELDRWLKILGFNRERVLVTNTVKCHTENNRVPKVPEISACVGAWLKREIETFTQVKAVFPLGKPALKALLNKVETPGLLQPFWLKVKFGDRELRVIPLPHPAFLLRQPGRKPEMYTQLLPKVREYLTRQLPEEYDRAR